MVTEVRQGEIYYRDFGPVIGSQTAKRRPVLVIQSDSRNRSNLVTTIVLPLTSVMAYGAHPDNVVVTKSQTGLPKDSVILTFQPATVNKEELIDFIGLLPRESLQRAIDGVQNAIAIPW